MSQIKRFAIRVCVLAAIFTTATASSIWAGPIVFADAFLPTDVFFQADNGGACIGDNATDTVTGFAPKKNGGGCDSLAFSLDLPGYDPLLDTLYTAVVSLAFHDDADKGSETLTIQLDALTKKVTVSKGSTNNNPFYYSFWNPLDQIALDGRVDLLLAQTGGDFYFDGAGIAAAGWRSDDPLTPIPEPASLLLMGSGAVALLARFRRKPRA